MRAHLGQEHLAELHHLRDRVTLLEQQLTLAEARLHATEHDAETWRRCPLANEKLHAEAVVELQRLRQGAP